MINVVLHLEGGIIQQVVSDKPLPADIRFFICDTDTDGTYPHDNKLSYMGDGCPAFFRGIDVGYPDPPLFKEFVPEDFQP